MINPRIGAASGRVIVAGLAGCASNDDAGEAGEMGMSDVGMESRVAGANYMPSGTYMREIPAGQIMTKPDGVTVYTYDQDTPDASSCYGDCAAEWPPVTASDDVQPFARMSIVERTETGRASGPTMECRCTSIATTPRRATPRAGSGTSCDKRAGRPGLRSNAPTGYGCPT